MFGNVLLDEHDEYDGRGSRLYNQRTRILSVTNGYFVILCSFAIITVSMMGVAVGVLVLLY